jgi:hypothetical protein
MASPNTLEQLCPPVPARFAIARLLDAHDQGHGIYITHLDVTPRRAKMCVNSISCEWIMVVILLDRVAFATIMFIVALVVALPLWCILSSRSTLYFVLYMALNNFITLPTPRSISWWAMLKALFVYWYIGRLGPFVRDALLQQLVPRLRFGFREKEVIFRKPTPGSDPSTNYFVESLSRAIDPIFLSRNIGIGTQVDFWILDYGAMNEATVGLRGGLFQEDTWKTTLWLKHDLQGWVAHEIWRQTEIACDPRFLVLLKVSYVSRLAISQWLSAKLQDKIAAAGKAEIYDEWMSRLGPIVSTITDNPLLRNQRIEEVSKTFLAQHGIDFTQMNEEVMRELRQTTEYVDSI